jgi:hypothetical protein
MRKLRSISKHLEKALAHLFQAYEPDCRPVSKNDRLKMHYTTMLKVLGVLSLYNAEKHGKIVTGQIAGVTQPLLSPQLRN